MEKGFVALTSVLVISAVVLSVAITVSMLAIGQGQSSLALTKGEETLSFVEGCTEDALLKLRASASYSGGSITRPEGTCSVNISNVGTIYTLTVTTADLIYKRTVEVVAVRGGSITITSWKEI